MAHANLTYCELFFEPQRVHPCREMIRKKNPQRVQEGGRQGRYRSRRCKDVSTTPLLFPSHLLSHSLSLCVLQWEIRACWEELLAFLSEDKACSGLVQLNPSAALSMVLNQLEGLQLLFYSLSLSLFLSLSKPPSIPSVSFSSQYSSSVHLKFSLFWSHMTEFDEIFKLES